MIFKYQKHVNKLKLKLNINFRHTFYINLKVPFLLKAKVFIVIRKWNNNMLTNG